MPKPSEVLTFAQKAFLQNGGIEFLDYTTDAIERILPHVTVSAWKNLPRTSAGATWASVQRRKILLTINLGTRLGSLQATIERRRRASGPGSQERTLDTREYSFCHVIGRKASSILRKASIIHHDDVLTAERELFDEQVVASFVREHHGLKLNVTEVLSTLRQLAEQTYENKAISFGLLLDPRDQTGASRLFPREFSHLKRIRVLSDGFNTAYRVSSNGKLLGLVDLEEESHEQHHLNSPHYPWWCKQLAMMSRNGVCGLALTRNGDILIFESGILRLTYRRGQWQYWNHSHIVQMLEDVGHAKRVPVADLRALVRLIYPAALDVSFRRSGGLFFLLRNKQRIHEVVRRGDCIADTGRKPIDKEFDAVAPPGPISRTTLRELAAIDGAVVLSTSGEVLAYGAVLTRRPSGQSLEGSRAQAAAGASALGIAIKISSDGGITVYHDESEYFSVGA